MKIQFEKITYDELDLDFEKIYEYVKKDIQKDYDLGKIDNGTIIDHFGDNMDAYIEEIYGYKISSLGEAENYNSCVLDGIWEEFGDWVEKNKKA